MSKEGEIFFMKILEVKLRKLFGPLVSKNQESTEKLLLLLYENYKEKTKFT